ncbi:MAG: hypothetical protein ABIP97_09875 [Chthoniobacterales bacterium]
MKRLLLILSLGLCGHAFADGGIVQLQRDIPPYRLTLFSEPSPLRAGPADLSVLVQKNGDPVLNAEVTLHLTPEESAANRPPDWKPACCAMGEACEEITLPAIQGSGPNKLLYSALATLPYSGNWKVIVTARENGNPVSMNGRILVQKPAASWIIYLPYLLLPIAIAVFFVLVQLAKKKTVH